jgi:hypothetical protein
MVWYKYVSLNVLKIYKYIFRFKWLIKQHGWQQFLSNIKNVYYLNNNFKGLKMDNIINQVLYFFYNYNVNFRIRRSKMKYLIFIKKKLFLPHLVKMSKLSSYLTDLRYKKRFYKQILYWYYNLVRPIKFNYNYNDLFKFFNRVIKRIKYHFFYLNLLMYKPLLYKKYRFFIFKRIKKLFITIFIQCLKVFKNFKNIKYFLFSFTIRKLKKKFIFRKNNLFLLKKNFNILYIINNIIQLFFTFLIKNWLDINLTFYNSNSLYINNNNLFLNFFNKKLFIYLVKKYRVAWKRLFKITASNYFKPINFIINYKKLNLY